VEGILKSTDQALAVGKSLSSLTNTNESLHSAGIEKMVYEDFYAEFASLIENIIQPHSDGTTLTMDLLLNAFQNPEGRFFFLSRFFCSHPHSIVVSNSVVIYLRFLTVRSFFLVYSYRIHSTYSQPRYVLTVNYTKAL
jgi:ubiquitin thioesterase protein OTUB1